MKYLRPFDRGDWSAYSGACEFPDGSGPYIWENERVTVIVDHIEAEASVTVMFNDAKWEDDLDPCEMRTNFEPYIFKANLVSAKGQAIVHAERIIDALVRPIPSYIWHDLDKTG